MKRTAFAIGMIVIVVLSASMVTLASRLSQLEKARNSEQWSCSKVVCTKYVDPAVWVAEHCTQDRAEATCTLAINNEQVRISLSSINQTYLSSQCAVLQCTEETQTRSANYTFEYNQSSFILQ